MAKILVLDDVIEAGILIKKILEKKGHTVYVFDEEEDALKYAKEYPVDLAILDIKLKKLTGIEVLAELKKIKKDMKAIMLTGYPTIETVRQAVTIGASEYCIKPIDKEELEEKVEKVLSAYL